MTTDDERPEPCAGCDPDAPGRHLLPPGYLDVGNGEGLAFGPPDDLYAAAEWLRCHYPDGVTGPRHGPMFGPVLNMGIRLVVEVLDHYQGTDVKKLWLLAFAESANDRTREGWPGRKLLAHRTGKSSARVSNIATELVEDGVIERTGGGGRHRGEAHYVLLPLVVGSDSQGSARANPGDPVDNSVDNPSQGSARANPKPEVKGSESNSQGSESCPQGSAISPLPAETPYNPQNPQVNQPSSLSRALGALGAAVPTLTEREIAAISRKLTSNPAIPHPAAYLRTVIGNGDAASWAAAALNSSGRPGSRQAETDALFGAAMDRAHALEATSGPRSEACRRRAHHPRECAYGNDWCTCSCHPSVREPKPLAALIGHLAPGNGSQAAP